MSYLYRLKPWKDIFLTPLCRGLDGIGMTPNALTMLGLLLSMAAGAAALWGHLYTGILLFIMGACCLISALQVIIYGRRSRKAEARQKTAL